MTMMTCGTVRRLRLSSIVTVTLFVLLTLTCGVSRGLILQKDPDSLSCTAARSRCDADITCRVLLDTIVKVCDASFSTCLTSQRLHCTSVLSALQTNMYFENCLCDQLDSDYNECLEVRRTIFTHHCVRRDDASQMPQTDESDNVDDTSCPGLRRRCLNDPTCNIALHELLQFCGRTTENPRKHGPCTAAKWQRCQQTVDELSSISPKLVTCTCPMTQSSDVIDKCERFRSRLNVSASECQESWRVISTASLPVENELSLPVPATLSDVITASNFHPTTVVLQECRQVLGHRQPVFTNPPSVIRLYDNATQCSELCQCHHNNTTLCRTLPCSPNRSCKHKADVYVHGSSFTTTERGPCRCLKGEIICAKSPFRLDQAGLFIHIGYSSIERHHVETNSPVRFHVDSIRSKLVALLSSVLDSQHRQACTLTSHRAFDGNIVFEILSTSRFSEQTRVSSAESCIVSAKALSHYINTRESTIVTDAELSLLKVAQLERIRFPEQATRRTYKFISRGWATLHRPSALNIMSLLYLAIFSTYLL